MRPSRLAIVPEEENRQPSLTVSAAQPGRTMAGAAKAAPLPARSMRRVRLFIGETPGTGNVVWTDTG